VTFTPGDRVRMAGLGKGVVREVRNHGRYLVEVKGRAMVVDGARLAPDDAPAPRRVKAAGPHTGTSAPDVPLAGSPARALDLHGRTVLEALEVLDAFLNAALLDGAPEVRIIHGRSGGRLKAAVHGRLQQITAVRAFRVEEANAGVTVVFL
jgi:DNA mismatch repair protein MutS2